MHLSISADMIIGFRTNMTIARENRLEFNIDVHSKIISELIYEIGFRHIQGNNPTDATVETRDNSDPIFDPEFDAKFGDRANPNNLLDPLESTQRLEKRQFIPQPQLFISLFSDFRPEEDECFTINIFTIDTGLDRDNFMCNENEKNPDDFFCAHTICILDDDG